MRAAMCRRRDAYSFKHYHRQMTLIAGQSKK
jgi:hypothetical protein